MRLCKEHPFADIENVICERCGFCEDTYYADSLQEHEEDIKDECY